MKFALDSSDLNSHSQNVSHDNYQLNLSVWLSSSGSSGRVRGGGGARNMKSMRRQPSFFMTYFHRSGGDGPLAPLDMLLRSV